MDPVSFVTTREHDSARAEIGGNNNRFISNLDDGLDKFVGVIYKHSYTEAEWKDFPRRLRYSIQVWQRLHPDVDESEKNINFELSDKSVAEGNLDVFYTETEGVPPSLQADNEKALECMRREFLDRFVAQEEINKMQRAAEMVTLQETMEKNLSDLGVNLQNMFMELFDRSEERVNILEEEFAKGLHEMRTLASTARPSERGGPQRFNTLSSQTVLSTPRSDMTRTLTVESTILRRLRQSSQDVRSQLGNYSVVVHRALCVK